MAVSLKDIARKAGTSNVTVSLALRDHPRISLARREQIKALAEQMGYRPDPVARAMRTRQSLTVGLLMADLQTGVANLKIDAIENQLTAAGYQTILGFTGGEAERLQTQLAGLSDRRVDGVIVYGHHGSAADWRNVSAALGNRMPACVLADFQTPVKGCRQVDIDRAAGTAALVQHLIDLGHRDLAFVTPSQALPHKWQGAQHQVREQSKSLQIKLRQIQFDSPDGLPALIEAAIAAGRSLAELPAAQRPTAVIAPSDTLAMAIIRGLVEAGLSVPRDISVTGFDGDDLATLLFRPALTTARQPREQMAEAIVGQLLGLTRGEKPPKNELAATLLGPTLIVGDSTAKPPEPRRG